ncbi:MAG: glycoside hydrolase family 3 protein [Desulfobacterales bacterium]|nr:glycoside hydrolase family 3 protein [Desulfobacterales bacterium]MCP4159451.1 glycoside hydrolase family 3 protein [Deltaproteobacteria bacterium]
MTFYSSLEDKAGQRIMVGFDGVSLNNDLKFLIKNIRVNGIILFKRNIESPEQVKDLISAAQEYAKSSGLPKLFVSIDQEGGTVSRLKEPFTQFPEGAAGIKTNEYAKYFAQVTASELKSIGVNMNMAPVLDIDPAGFNGIMKKRALGNTPQQVSVLGLSIINNLEKNRVMAVGKHFPGIGRTVLDSHFELPKLDLTIEELNDFELKPFEAAIRNGVSGLMISHILYTKLDEKWPASLSPKIAKDLLRDKLGYDGLLITDDLDMKAVKHDIRTSVKQVLKSDIDIPLICKSGKRVEEAFDEIMRNLKDSNELEISGNKSLERILKLKKTFL